MKTRTPTQFETAVDKFAAYDNRPYGTRGSDPETSVISRIGLSLKKVRRLGAVVLSSAVAGAAFGPGVVQDVEHAAGDILSGSSSVQVSETQAQQASRQIQANEHDSTPVLDAPNDAEVRARVPAWQPLNQKYPSHSNL